MGGIGIYHVDMTKNGGTAGETEKGITLGLGIPNTPIFIDMNYKHVEMGGYLSAYDFNTTYIGIGYNFLLGLKP